MVRVEIEDLNLDRYVREVDKYEIRGDLIFLYEDVNKDNEIAPLPEYQLSEVMVFEKLRFEEMDEEDGD